MKITLLCRDGRTRRRSTWSTRTALWATAGPRSRMCALFCLLLLQRIDTMVAQSVDSSFRHVLGVRHYDYDICLKVPQMSVPFEIRVTLTGFLLKKDDINAKMDKTWIMD